MKTAISIRDDLFKRANELAERLGKPRSRIFAEAIEEYLLRRDAEAITDGWNQACEEMGHGADPVVGAAAHRVLERSEW